MEKDYPVLKRPKRKLCYLTRIQNSHKENWGPKLSLGDVDRMFDDLDCVSDVEACEENQEATCASPAPLRRASRPGKCQTPPREARLSPATQSLSPELHIQLPFEKHGPMKTSSPIEVGRDAVQTESNNKDKELSPILFDCQEAEGRTPPPSDKKANEDVSENFPGPSRGDSGLGREVQISRSPATSSRAFPGQLRDEIPPACPRNLDSDLESPPSHVVICKPTSSHKTGMAAPLHNESPTACREKNVSRKSSYWEPQVSPPERELAVETPGQVKIDMSAFLQKLRDAGQPKASAVIKSLTPVKPPPVSEDDFLILEDEEPFRFSIPSKSATTPHRSKRSSSDKDSLTDKGSKGSSPERTPKRPAADVSRRKPLKKTTVGQKATKNRREQRKNAVGTAGDKAPSPDDIPAAEPLPCESNTKKARPREKAPPDMAEDQQKKPDRTQTDDEKAQTSSVVKRLKSSKTSRDSLKTSRPGGPKVKGIHQKQSSKEHADLGSPSDLVELNVDPVQDLAAGNPEQIEHSCSGGRSSSEGQVLRKRKINLPGEWWLSCPQNTKQLREQPSIVKNSKQREANPAAPSPAKAEKECLLKRTSKKSKKTKGAKVEQKKRYRGDNTDTVEPNTDEDEQMDAQEQEVAQQDTGPMLCSPLELRDHSENSEHQPFQRVYPQPGRKKVPVPVPLSPRGSPERQTGKRNRKPPGEWWKVTSTPENTEFSPTKPRRQSPKKSHASKEQKTRSKQRTNPAEGDAAVALFSKRALFVPKSIKSLMDTNEDMFSLHTESTVVLGSGDADQNNEVQTPDSGTPRNTHQATVGIDVSRANNANPQDFQNTFSILRSGPSSIIDLEMHKDTDPTLSRSVPAELSVCDLCAPPLKPFVLQAKDKANLTRWLRILWSTTLKNASKFSPDHFDWYTHRGRAMGILEDLHCGNISHGKILLGSFMRKPLWVDHTATTVFNLLTSSVNVTINCTQSCVHAGQSFMVPCGQAYSIQNLVAQPVVLCFTRVLAESPD